MMLIIEYQPKSKGLKMLSDSVLEILIFKIFLGGACPPTPLVWHASHAVCFTDYCSTITIVSPEMDTVCYIHYVLQPHIYYVLQKLAPPPENPRSAPVMSMIVSSQYRN